MAGTHAGVSGASDDTRGSAEGQGCKCGHAGLTRVLPGVFDHVQAYYTVFDAGQKKVGFAAAKPQPALPEAGFVGSAWFWFLVFAALCACVGCAVMMYVGYDSKRRRQRERLYAQAFHLTNDEAAAVVGTAQYAQMTDTTPPGLHL